MSQFLDDVYLATMMERTVALNRADRLGPLHAELATGRRPSPIRQHVRLALGAARRVWLVVADSFEDRPSTIGPTHGAMGVESQTSEVRG